MGESTQSISAAEIESVVASLRRITKWERSIARKRLTAVLSGRLPAMERQLVEKGPESCAYELIARFDVLPAGVFWLMGFVLIFTRGHSSSLLGVEIASLILSFLTIVLALLRLRQVMSAVRRFTVSLGRH